MSRTRVVLVAVAALLAGTASGGPAGAATTSPTFARTDHQQLGNNHVLADFNADGRLDIAGIGAQSVAVLLSTGNGTFGGRVEYPVATWAQDLAAGDVNGDGRTDLVVTINDPRTGLAMLLGNGDGTFRTPVNFANTSGFDSPAVVAVDLNNDSRLDVVIAHQIACYTAPCRVARGISVMIGNGNGTFQPTREVDVGTGMSKIAVGDFNRDGRKDLAIAGDSSRVYRLYGVGDGTFVQQPTLTMTADTFGVDATDIDVADFNRDTIQDLVVAVGLNGSRTAILIGVGDGTFRPPLIITQPTMNVPQYQAVADYNGDGFQDLAITFGDGTFGLMEIRNGNGDGTFQSGVRYLVPPAKSSIGGFAIVAGQLTADSKPDLVVGIVGASPGLAVLINTTGSTPPATPAAPTLLAPAQDATPAQPVAFDWTDVTAATSYRIQIDDSSTFSAPLVVDRTVTASQLSAPALAARQHWWRVRGVNSAGVAGAWSSARRFTPQASSPQPSPSPSPPPGSTATLSVTATGRSGERVTSSPAGISVTVGSTGSASFATQTVITLSATNGRDVIWSGACSSGGSKTKTCTFTLSTSATVTANVQ